MPGRSRLLRRLSVYGDVWTRVLEWGARHSPSWLEPILLGVYGTVFWALCGRQRRAVAANLRVVHPSWSAFHAQFGALRVVYNFGSSLVDAARVSAGRDVIDWDIEGLGNFEQLSNSEGGAVVLTAHMGNYDLAAPVFAGRFGRRLNAVRAPEREAELQAHYERRRSESEDETFAVRYNADGAMLAVELAKLLGEGELVALQGDRVLFEVSPVIGEMFGREARLPKGPFALAMASGARVWPLFILRDGWRRYRIRVGESFEVSGERGSRDDAVKRGVERWCEELEAVVDGWWYQWFVFEEVFGASTGERRQIPAPGEAEPAVCGSRRGLPALTFALSGLATGAALLLSARWLWGSPAIVATPVVAFAGLHAVGLVQAGISAMARRFAP